MPVLEVTTVIGCPLMCTFCPQLDLRKAYGKSDRVLSYEDYVTLIDKVPTHVLISFAGMSEPWANPDATRMVRYTLDRGHEVAIYTTLDGMSEDDADEVIQLLTAHASSVRTLCLHLPDAHGNMKGFRMSDTYETVLKKFIAFRKVSPLRNFTVMTMSGSGDYHPGVAMLMVEKARPFRGNSRAGSLETKDVAPPPTPRNEFALMCASTPFYDHNVLLPNGDVVLCCMDYRLKHVIGNLHQSDYYGLFAGEELNRVRVENMKPEFSKCSICKSCDNVRSADDYAPPPPTFRTVFEHQVVNRLPLWVKGK